MTLVKRGHSYWLDGERVISVTSAKREGFPQPGLMKWRSDVSGRYVLDHWDELLEMQPSEREIAVRDAHRSPLREAQIRGTKVHEYAQQLAEGHDVDVPDPYLGHVDAYLRFVREWRPRELLVEAAVGSRTHRYAGTLDLIADLADERRWLLDFKTKKGEPWPEDALQLAGYRFADFALVNGDEIELSDYRIEACGIVWLRADGYDLIPIDADEEAFIAFRAAKHLASFRSEPRDRWVRDALMPPELEATT